jgi:hypothetical protein
VAFSWYSGFPTNKTDRHVITEILLKVALNTITLTSCYNSRYFVLSRFDFDVMHFSKFLIGFVSLSTGKMETFAHFLFDSKIIEVISL